MTVQSWNAVNQEKTRSVPASAVDLHELQQVILELTGLLDSTKEPGEFFGTYLEKVIDVTGAIATAVWQRKNSGQLELLKEYNFEALNLNKFSDGIACHQLLLEDSTLSRRIHWIAPKVIEDRKGIIKANLSPFALLLAPIVIDNMAVGVLEVCLKPDQERESKRVFIRLVTELAIFAAAFLQKLQWHGMQGMQQHWQQLEKFTIGIHRSLNPTEIGYLVANDGKQLLDCDQLAIAQFEPTRKKCKILAISGAVAINRNSPLILAMESLLGFV